MDVEVAFVPVEETETVAALLTEEATWSSKIVLEVRFGAAMVGVDVPILIKGISFAAKARTECKLKAQMPFISKIEFCFLETPKIDFVLKPLKSFDMMDLPGLAKYLDSVIESSLVSMINPNKMLIDMEPLAVFGESGITQITIGELRMKKSDKIDAYVKVSVLEKQIYKTKFVKDERFPYWNETCYFVSDNLNKEVEFEVWDHNLIDDKFLGRASMSLKELFYNPKQRVWWLDVFKIEGRKPVGKLQVAAIFHVSQQQTLRVDNASALNEDMGILKVNIQQAKEILSAKNFNLFVEMSFAKLARSASSNLLNLDSEDNVLFKTRIKKESKSPIWCEEMSIVVRDLDDRLRFQLIDKSDTIGSSSNPLGDVLLSIKDVIEVDDQWYKLTDGSKLKLDFDYISVDTVKGDTECIGVGKIELKEAKLPETYGKSPFLVRLRFGSKPDIHFVAKSRSATLQQPIFQQTLYFRAFDLDLFIDLFKIGFSGNEELIGSCVIDKSLNGSASNVFLDSEGENIGSISYLFHGIKGFVESSGDSPLEELEVSETKSQTTTAQGTTSAQSEGTHTQSAQSTNSQSVQNHQSEHKTNSTSETSDSKSIEDVNLDPLSPQEIKAKKGFLKRSTGKIGRVLSKGTSKVTGAVGKGGSLVTGVVGKGVNVVAKGGSLVGGVIKGGAGFLLNGVEENEIIPRSAGDGRANCGILSILLKECDVDNVIGNVRINNEPLLDTFELGLLSETLILNDHAAKIFLTLSDKQSHSREPLGIASFDLNGLSFEKELTLLKIDGTEGPKIKIALKYKQVDLFYKPTEVSSEKGLLYVQLLSATDLIAGDASGFSDPFVILNLDFEKVAKSQKVKKTLNPSFNETF